MCMMFIICFISLSIFPSRLVSEETVSPIPVKKVNFVDENAKKISINERIYLRNGDSSGNRMQCESHSVGDIVDSIFFLRRNRKGQWEPIHIPHDRCQDDICIYRNTDAGIGRITLRKFNATLHSGLYKCTVNHNKGVFVWRVLQIDEELVNETLPTEDIVVYGESAIGCYDPFPRSGLKERFKAIRIQCRISRYVLDVENKNSVNWYYRNGSEDIRVLGKGSHKQNRPFQSKGSDSHSKEVVVRYLYVPERTLAMDKWNGTYVCSAGDRDDYLEIKKVIVQRQNKRPIN